MPPRAPLQSFCSSCLYTTKNTGASSRSFVTTLRSRQSREYRPKLPSLSRWAVASTRQASIDTSISESEPLEETSSDPSTQGQPSLRRQIYNLPILRTGKTRIDPPKNDKKMDEWMAKFLIRQERDRKAEEQSPKMDLRLDLTAEEKSDAAKRAAEILQRHRDRISQLSREEAVHMSEEQVYNQYGGMRKESRSAREDVERMADTELSKPLSSSENVVKEQPVSDVSGIEPDYSSRLTTYSSTRAKNNLTRNLGLFLSLTKPRLSFLVTLTTVAAYAIYPTPEALQSLELEILGHSPLLDPAVFVFLTAGTFLSAACANACNMLMEPKYDAQMTRTRNRPLARGLLSSRAAIIFAILSGGLGLTSLYMGVNPTTAALGAANIILYVGVYTPMKRIHWTNTLIGAVVGGIPPLMGWTAAAGLFAPSAGTDPWELLWDDKYALSGWSLATLLLLWQIPHFAAVSWGVRHEYMNAGYKMLAWMNPRLDATLGVACAVGMFAPLVVLDQQGVIEPWATALGTLFSAGLLLRAVQFRAAEGQKGTARQLFFASHWYLSFLMIACMVGKKGFLGSLWSRWTGEDELDEEAFYDDEEVQGKQLIKA
jgi:protoheme IX farnesyltransferase